MSETCSQNPKSRVRFLLIYRGLGKKITPSLFCEVGTGYPSLKYAIRGLAVRYTKTVNFSLARGATHFYLIPEFLAPQDVD